MENLQSEAINFIQNPGDSSFESICQKIYKSCLDQPNGNPELKNVIVNIINITCENIISLPLNEGEGNIDYLERRLNEFTRIIVLLENIFSYYDSQVEKPEKVTEIAVQTILSKYFTLETTITSLQEDLSEIFNPFLRDNGIIPASIKFPALFIYTIDPELYKKIFETTITKEVNIYFQTLNIEEKDPFEQIDFLYTIYIYVSEAISTYLQPSTVALFKELFCKGVMKKDQLIDKLVSEEALLHMQDQELLGKLFSLVKLGTSQWEDSFINHYSTNIRTKLNLIISGINEDSSQAETSSIENASSDKISTPKESLVLSDKFYDFAERVSNFFTETQEIIQNYLDNSEAVSKSVWNTFSRFLRGHNFTHELCLYLDKTVTMQPFLTVLCGFIKGDTSFEENYGIFMTHRLLLHPDPEKEEELLTSLKEAGIELEKPRLMLDDFVKSPKIDIRYGENETQVSLVMLHKFCWPSLHIPEFDPPQLFIDMFDSSVHELDFNDSRKTIRMSDRYSTVEFSDGTRTFSLPFVHACIVHTILSEGPMSREQICSKLNMKKQLAIEKINSLLQTKILIEDENDHKLAFLGPPTVSFKSEGNSGKEGETGDNQDIGPDRMPEDPVLYTDCSDQIDAAILRFLKQRRFAPSKEIKEAVYSMVPNKFPVTDAKIETCLQKLFEKELIMHHGGNSDSYRYCRH